MTNIETKTLLKQDIKPGDYIAYGQALGRCAALNIGRVIEAGLKNVKSWTPRDEFRCTIKAIDWDWRTQSYIAAKTKRTLQFAERIVVLHPDTVPQEIKDILK